LLDIILRLKDTRLQMWEDVLKSLRGLNIADQEELGKLLEAVQNSVKQYVPADWAEAPHLRVTDLTREALRRSLTVFMGTGASRPDGQPYAAPFQHQGTGTINTLVLALLTIVAELKQNVIFAMEEPEIALPPHTQKRIINAVRERSAQAIFTSHSPYVLEEFEPNQVQVLRRARGILRGTAAAFPPSVKPKAYRNEFRTRFCEALLAKHVLVLEGRTEFDAMPAAARRLHELRPDLYKAFEALGVAVVDAQGESNVAPLGRYFKSLGKQVYAVCDRQEDAARADIEAAVHLLFESPSDGFEDLVLTHTTEAALRRYAASVVEAREWPQHLAARTPSPNTELPVVRAALRDYFGWAKGRGDAGDLLAVCQHDEVPEYVRRVVLTMTLCIEPPRAPAAAQPDVQAQGAPEAAAMRKPPRVYAKFVPTPPIPVPPEP
jgi:putative ATP-dependent endonuclease of the OLD family